MKICRDRVFIEDYSTRAYRMYFGGMTPAVLDIETTGLDARRDRVVLAGLFLPESGHFHSGSRSPWTAVQLLAETEADEARLLTRTADILRDFDFLITYNGRSFDLPFLKKRAARVLDQPSAAAFSDFLDSRYNLDLYQLVRGYSPLRKVLTKLTQKNIELYMGLAAGRDDLISGGESAKMFRDYAESKSPELEKLILLHNHDDIIQLRRILPILDSCDLHEGLNHLGFPAGPFIIQAVTVNERALTAEISGPVPDYRSFPSLDFPCRITSSAADRGAKIEFFADQAAPGLSVLDASLLLGCSDQEAFESRFPALADLPSVESGYLILQQDDKNSPIGTAAFLLAFLKNFKY